MEPRRCWNCGTLEYLTYNAGQLIGRCPHGCPPPLTFTSASTIPLARAALTQEGEG